PEPREPCWRRTHPFFEVGQSEAARLGLGPQHRQQKLHRSDTAPGAREVSLVELLELGWAGGVVGGDEIDGSVGEPIPQPFAVLALAYGRRAFEPRVAV